METSPAANLEVREVADLDVRIALDDFGTGYSSLAYLRRLPISVLKVDQYFVDRLGKDPKDEAIVRAIITMARDLGLAVIGEGIETAEQLAELRALGCAYGQGYLFDRPLPSQAADELLSAVAERRRGPLVARRAAWDPRAIPTGDPVTFPEQRLRRPDRRKVS